jgi:hypothetical protein
MLRIYNNLRERAEAFTSTPQDLDHIINLDGLIHDAVVKNKLPSIPEENQQGIKP